VPFQLPLLPPPLQSDDGGGTDLASLMQNLQAEGGEGAGAAAPKWEKNDRVLVVEGAWLWPGCGLRRAACWPEPAGGTCWQWQWQWLTRPHTHEPPCLFGCPGDPAVDQRMDYRLCTLPQPSLSSGG
jgi:hypothetical protein